MAKPKVVLVQQSNTGVINKVRIDGTEFDVTHAGPVIVNGTMGVTLTITDVEVSAEVLNDQPPSAPRSEAKSR
jgi:hypothetical protein